MRTVTINACLIACLAVGTVTAQNFDRRQPATPAPGQLPASPGERLSAEDCLVKLIHRTRVPAQVEGMLTDLNAEEGNSVEAGQVIAVIDGEQATLMLEVRKAEEMEALLAAENDVNLRDAKAQEASAGAEYKSYQQMLESGSLPFWEVEKKRLEWKRQILRIELAELEAKQAKTTLIAKKRSRELAELDLKKRQVTSPYAGYVETRIAQLGEWVQPGSPMFEIVQMDKVRVEGDINAFQNPAAIVRGAPVRVQVQTSNPQEQWYNVDARIGFVSAQVDLAGNRRIWVDVPNVRKGDDWVIMPGMQAVITLLDNPELAKR